MTAPRINQQQGEERSVDAELYPQTFLPHAFGGVTDHHVIREHHEAREQNPGALWIKAQKRQEPQQVPRIQRGGEQERAADEPHRTLERRHIAAVYRDSHGGEDRRRDRFGNGRRTRDEIQERKSAVVEAPGGADLEDAVEVLIEIWVKRAEEQS